ncbi:unnamed protein product [Spodoptera littoralis]|uniref:Lipase domain-containing protein n=1 Tax=Spodoptera littoralis TaxID=7109 RepID=A0A9P0IB31_SPOLI|nr:unnamed protein product [Spodoptera littoralis]CAH1642671.1 unnamed protein product [Spodoptera littoralis]
MILWSAFFIFLCVIVKLIKQVNTMVRFTDLCKKFGQVFIPAKYDPDTQNSYLLYTRKNPTECQTLLLGNEKLLEASNFNPNHRTAVLLHGWIDHPDGRFSKIVRSAFLEADDMNVIVVDWKDGADIANYFTGIKNTVKSGEGVARFIAWLNHMTGADLSLYHIVGYSMGGHQAGVVGRNLDGKVGYITGLDPAGPFWRFNKHKLKKTDAQYTEVIHTHRWLGYFAPLGHVDFYPNSGVWNTCKCWTVICTHDRCFKYFAESLRSGGFTGRRCRNLRDAKLGRSTLPETLKMGGVIPKTGRTGIYYMQTNETPPFSRG